MIIAGRSIHTDCSTTPSTARSISKSSTQQKSPQVKEGGSLVLSWTLWSGGIGNTDEWHFSLSLILAFSGGQHVAVQEDELRLTAGQPPLTFGL